VIIYSKDKSYKKFYKEIIDQQSWQSSLHTQSALNYYKQRPLDEGKEVQDKSFILLWDDNPVIAFQGAIIEKDKKSILQYYEVPCISIEDKNKLTKKAYKAFLKEFDKVTINVNKNIIFRDYIIDNNISELSRYLLLQGAKAVPYFSRIIDLSQSETEIKRLLRKSYNSLINWGLRELKPKILDNSNLSWDNILEFRELHIRESGRETRSVHSWRKQFDMVKAGEAYLVVGYLKDDLVSAGFFMHSNTNCYYGSSASRRDLFGKPLFHSLMWKSICYAKSIGIQWFDLGEQLFPNHPPEVLPSKKKIGISGFKAGFGGQTRMFLDMKLDLNKDN
jgi:hypothetical protein